MKKIISIIITSLSGILLMIASFLIPEFKKELEIHSLLGILFLGSLLFVTLLIQIDAAKNRGTAYAINRRRMNARFFIIFTTIILLIITLGLFICIPSNPYSLTINACLGSMILLMVANCVLNSKKIY